MISLLLLLILLFGLLRGLKRGFIVQLMHLVGFILAFIVSTIFYKKFAVTLSHWIPYPELGENTMWAIFDSAMPLESAFYNGISFVLIFFATKIILQIIASMLDFLAQLPLLRTVNKLLGAGLGFLEVYFVMFIILYLTALVPIEKVQTMIDNSVVAKIIISRTPFLSNGVESLFFNEFLSKFL